MSDSGEQPQSVEPVEDLEDLYANAPCGYLSLRPDGSIVKVNNTLSSWSGFPPEQMLGKRFRDLLTVGTRILYETSCAPLLAMHGSFEEVSLDIRTAAGGALAVIANGKVLKEADGRPRLIRMAFFRATERRRYERQIVDAHKLSQELERVTQERLKTERENSELREQFIAVLGHDLRNPLAAIDGGVRLLSKKAQDDQSRMLVTAVQGSVKRMARLIDDVMDFARGRLGGGIPIAEQPDIDLGSLIEPVILEFRAGYPDRKINARFERHDTIRCDLSRMQQLLSNLVGNALTHGDEASPVDIDAVKTNGQFELSVANSGRQILAASLDDLFKPFVREKDRRSRQGLGLGLYICSEIAKAHGGSLDVTSSAAETRFTLRMPAA